MSEEIENAALNVPRAIFTTMILNGATGFAMLIAVLFCLGDIDTIIVSATILVPEAASDAGDRIHRPDFPSSKHSTMEQDPKLGRR